MTIATSNSTVLGVAPLSKTLPVVGLVLLALFVFVKPEATAGYPFLARLAFWALHIGLGLGSIVLASTLLRPAAMRRLPLAIAVLITGLAGASMLAPLYVLLEALTPADLVDPPDDWLDLFAARGPLQAVLAEFIEVAPMFTGAWFAVNLPLLLARVELAGRPPEPPSGGDPSPGEGGVGSPAHGPGRSAAPVAPATEAAAPADSVQQEDSPRGFLSLVPRALGEDVIALSSDMHYLHVHTTLGKCMVLGTLRDAAADLGDRGMLVHRSHWVAHGHVRRVLRGGSGWQCLMSNELRIPVSRRKQGEVAEWYGQAGNVVAMAARKAG